MLGVRLNALATSVGFSGDDKPIKALSRELESGGAGTVTPTDDNTAGRNLRDAVTKLSEQGGVRIVTHGSDTGRTVSNARRKHKRTPRRST